MSTTEDIKNRIISAVEHELKKINSNFESSTLKNSVENAFAIAIAPEIKLIERMIEEAGKQGNPKTANSKQNSDIGMLEKWGEVILGRQPYSAQPAEYDVDVTGTATSIPVGTTFVDDNGFVYIVTWGDEISYPITVQAIGEGSNVIQPNGTKLYLQQQIAGIDDEATILDISSKPFPAETIEEYRKNIIDVLQNQPRGGALGDFKLWAEEVNGVFKAFPYTFTPNIGNVFILQERSSSNIWGTPTDSNIIQNVIAHLKPKEPIGADINVLSCGFMQFNIEVNLFNNATEEQNKATDAINNYFLKKFPFVEGVDNEELRQDEISQAELMQEVSNSLAEDNYLISLKILFGGTEIYKTNLTEGNIGKPIISF